MNHQILTGLKERYPMLIGLTGVLWVLILAVSSLTSAYYFRLVSGGAGTFAATVLIAATGVVVFMKLAGDGKPELFLLSGITVMLQLATAAALPLLYYTSGYAPQQVLHIARKFEYNVLLFYAAAACALVLLRLIERGKQRWSTLICVLLCAAGGGLTVLILLFSRNNSTIVFGVQVGFFATALIMMQTVLAWWEPSKNRRIVYLVFAALLALSMVIKGETGLLFVLGLSAAVWAMTLNDKRNRKTYLVIGGTILFAVAVCWVLVACYHRNPQFNPAFIRVLARKAADRTDYMPKEGEASQMSQVLMSLKASRWLGNSRNYVYVSAGASDFSVTTVIRSIGKLFLPVLLICTSLMTFELVRSKRSGERYGILSELCFCIVTVMIFYNSAMSVCAAPIIGVSCYAGGKGYAHHLFCGLLFGAIFSQSGRFDPLRVWKQKGGN